MTKRSRSFICLLFSIFLCADVLIWGIQLKPAEIIRNQLSLTRLVDRITSVDEQSGFCLCPFHGDKSPSMKVNEGPGYYYCFACGESGNAVKFVSKILNSSYEEAVHTCMRMIENEEELDR